VVTASGTNSIRVCHLAASVHRALTVGPAGASGTQTLVLSRLCLQLHFRPPRTVQRSLLVTLILTGVGFFIAKPMPALPSLSVPLFSEFPTAFVHRNRIELVRRSQGEPVSCYVSYLVAYTFAEERAKSSVTKAPGAYSGCSTPGLPTPFTPMVSIPALNIRPKCHGLRILKGEFTCS